MTTDPFKSYDAEYHRSVATSARSSAEVVVPLLLDLFTPTSVIDVGCGTGAWLAVFGEQGVSDAIGVDGPHLDRSSLVIPDESFIAHDLEEPLRLDRAFDLVVSLEVAEHLAPTHAAQFVETVTRLGAQVLFSAAIPSQGGKHHVNEQWPEYWAGLFSERGFVPVDCLRRKIWQDPRVDWWYAQNLLLYVSRDRLDELPALKDEFELMGTSQLSLVHPRKYVYCLEWAMELQEQSAE